MFCYYTLAISTEPISFFTGVSRTFFTAEGRFLSVVSSEVMLVMTVVVTVAARRKTCFPTADAVIATKAEPSEDAIGFLYLFLSCPIPLNVHHKSSFMVRYRFCKALHHYILACNHHFTPRNRVFDVLGEYYVALETLISSLCHHNNHLTPRKCSKQRGGNGGKWARGALRLCYKPTGKRWFGGLRFLTVPLMNKK